MKKNVAILLFQEVEVLDFAGPFEVFSITENESGKIFNCFTVSEHDTIIHARNGLKVKASYSIMDCPKIDVLIVPGGYGAEKIEIHNTRLLDWISGQAKKVELVASICTGAFLLAKAGVITDQTVTTHWMDIKQLQHDFPNLKVQEHVDFVDNGKIMTSAGISAGIKLSLHIVGKLAGEQIAMTTAKRMQYDWKT